MGRAVGDRRATKHMSTLSSTGSQQPRAHHGFALWSLGFRPFYLLAATFAAMSVAVWALQMSGAIDFAYLAGPIWHAHEMIFGYTLAVAVGFLFTAGQNWTGQPTPKGTALAALACLWVAGRVLVLTPWAVAAAIVNVAFPLAAAVGLARPLIAAGNRRNYFFIGLLLLMAMAQAAVHAVQAGLLSLPPTIGVQFGLDIVLFMMAVVGGRVIPMFTNNGVPGAMAIRRARVEQLALGSVLALLLADGSGLRGWWLVPLLILAASAHAARLWLWQPWRTLRTPLVWILHAAYLWIPVHLVLRVFAEAGVIFPSLAIHALTVGAIGALTLGMMTRTTRGHTGRPLRADWWDTLAYFAVCGAAVIRVIAPLLGLVTLNGAALAAGVLWALAFMIYVVRYAPLLIRPRADGLPG